MCKQYVNEMLLMIVTVTIETPHNIKSIMRVGWSIIVIKRRGVNGICGLIVTNFIMRQATS